MAFDPKDPVNDEETARATEATVKLATHALDGLQLPDQELEALCDAALSEERTRQIITEDKDPITRQLRSDTYSGKTRSKVSASDPAASPLSTDDEAAGVTASADRIEMAREAERKIGEAVKKKDGS